MFKKVALITGIIFLGLNFGLISGVMPIFLIIGLALFKDGLSSTVVAASSLIAGIVSAIIGYIYSYRKKREHEDVSPYVSALVWSFVLGALVACVALFIYAGGDAYRI